MRQRHMAGRRTGRYIYYAFCNGEGNLRVTKTDDTQRKDKVESQRGYLIFQTSRYACCAISFARF